MQGEVAVALLFQTDPDIIEMRKNYLQVFFDVFNQGFKNFLKGDWKVARRMLKQVESIKKSPDGPS